MAPRSRNHELAIVASALIVLTIVYAAIFLPFLAGGWMIGNDYSIYFPSLLAGYYWFVNNGLFAIPWFTPSECGGFPYFPDPNAAWFSAPQFLTFAVGPLGAVRAILIVFAMLGFGGFYLLMRRSFRASVPASLMAAAIFMFNGYFIYRHLAGHMTFHASMLTPWIALALLPAERGKPALSGWVLRICAAGAGFAYMYQAGMIHGILPALLAIVIILAIHAFIFGWRVFPWGGLAASGLLMLALCAGKFAAGLALAHQFPRSEYELPGVPNLFSLIWTAFRALFWWGARRRARPVREPAIRDAAARVGIWRVARAAAVDAGLAGVHRNPAGARARGRSLAVAEDRGPGRGGPAVAGSAAAEFLYRRLERIPKEPAVLRQFQSADPLVLGLYPGCRAAGGAGA